tara:strand:- start:68 stop:724 length:657 start_codon:yes stop_codon:yes gene_type:complete
MGFLNNTTVTLDAILTKKGRELLARGDGSFRITQFALADDEIDYTLYNPTHPSGSGFYGEAIENMPLLEAFPDETQIMKYKLVTLPRGTARMPVIDIAIPSVSFKQGTAFTVRPQTLNYLSQSQAFETSGYTFTISDVRLLNSFNGVGIDTPEVQALNSTSTIGTSVSKTVVGTSLSMTATTINTLFGTNTSLTATLVIVGRDSGARVSIPVTVTKVQ